MGATYLKAVSDRIFFKDLVTHILRTARCIVSQRMCTAVTLRVGTKGTRMLLKKERPAVTSLLMNMRILNFECYNY